MDPSIFVSIIVPARNEENRLAQCIEAMLALDWSGAAYEIIVIDNGSSDQTAAVAAHYPVVLLHESVPGPSRARNAGIRAAQGSILAFVDADCTPEKTWLQELLRGVEDQSIGCFAGEFAPPRSASFVSGYVHDRNLIHQETLLRYSPPVVATGNAAYRREVFTTIGFFDESLTAGEDADLSFRMQKTGRYRIRYNPNAVVSHAHPDSIPQFLKRSYRIGKGIARVRSKHAADFSEKCFRPRRLLGEMGATLAGAVKIPWRMAACFRAGWPARKAVWYPIFDKIHAVSQALGIWAEERRIGTHLPPNSSDIGRLNLESAPLFAAPHPGLSERTRGELMALAQILTRHLRNATILLTGSFSVGEGKASPPAILSDYDLVAVTPRLADALPGWTKKKIQKDVDRLGLSADLDISLIWKPFLTFGLTATGGRIIAGPTHLKKNIAALTPPSARKANLGAHRLLAQAPVSPQYSMFMSKAVVRSFQAYLLDRFKHRSRTTWIQLSSIRYMEKALDEVGGLMNEDAVMLVKKACRGLLDLHPPAWTREEYPEARTLLSHLGKALTPTLRWQDFVKHALWLKTRRFSGVPSFRSEAIALQSLRHLCAAWGPAGDLDPNQVSKASCIMEKLCRHGIPPHSDPLETYRRLLDLLTGYIDFYPHKLRFGRKEATP